MTQYIPIGALKLGVNLAPPAGYTTIVSVQVVNNAGGDLCLKVVWS